MRKEDERHSAVFTNVYFYYLNGWVDEALKDLSKRNLENSKIKVSNVPRFSIDLNI